jgi:hypothetical protein
MNTGLPQTSVFALAVDPTTPSTIYAGTYGGGVLKRLDGTGSWAPINTGLTNLSVPDLAIDPATASTVYAGTEGGVFKSTNGAASWVAMNSGLTTVESKVSAADRRNGESQLPAAFATAPVPHAVP